MMGNLEKGIVPIIRQLEAAVGNLFQKFTGQWVFNFYEGELLDWKFTRTGKKEKNKSDK